MKKQLFFFLAIIMFAIRSFGQGRTLDTADYAERGFRHQPQLTGDSHITGDGKYSAVEGQDENGHVDLKIKAVHGSWMLNIHDCGYVFTFADHDRLGVFIKEPATLCLVQLGGKQVTYIPHVASFDVAPKESRWLVYRPDTGKQVLVLRDLDTKKEQRFYHILSYKFASSSDLVLERSANDGLTELLWVDLAYDSLTAIWQGRHHAGLIFTADGSVTAFTGDSKSSEKTAVWYYHRGNRYADPILSGDSIAKRAGFNIGELSLRSFNSTGDRFFFSVLKRVQQTKPDPALASVDVYSYKDPMLQSMQLKNVKKIIETVWVCHLANKKLVQLTGDNELILGKYPNNKHLINYLLIVKNGGGDGFGEWNWNPNAKNAVYLVSTFNGKKVCLVRDKSNQIVNTYTLSPEEKYVIYYDDQRNDFCSYRIADGQTHNVTNGSNAQWVTEGWIDYPYSLGLYTISGWLKNDAGVLLKSQTDIYQADPEGQKPLIDLTGNFGTKDHVEYAPLEIRKSESAEEIDPAHPFVLRAFDHKTKSIGFCQILPGRENKPQIFQWLPYFDYWVDKSKNADVYLFSLENAESSPNWFITTDLKEFKPLTDIHPERNFNWLTSELVTYQALDGTTTQGILYKPQDFDPAKKYPIIFHYYERMSDDLHRFLAPEYVNAAQKLDIPTYVSNGYLVFLPDIHYTIGYPGKSAYNSIVGAAKYLSRFNWVDTLHMGLMGHSFGGFETDYVITHCHMFAAAVSSAGMTDFISAYGSIIGNGSSRQKQYELYRDRIGSTLWQHPELYIENSPVFLADKVITPVLLMANHGDEDVPYEQGVEFFTALRRLQKRSWMLQYDNDGHGLFDLKDQKDYTIRERQFFDHYLKGMPPPKWMTEGIPAKLKQVDAGFEIDHSGRTP